MQQKSKKIKVGKLTKGTLTRNAELLVLIIILVNYKKSFNEKDELILFMKACPAPIFLWMKVIKPPRQD